MLVISLIVNCLLVVERMFKHIKKSSCCLGTMETYDDINDENKK